MAKPKPKSPGDTRASTLPRLRDHVTKAVRQAIAIGAGYTGPYYLVGDYAFTSYDLVEAQTMTACKVRREDIAAQLGCSAWHVGELLKRGEEKVA